MSDWPPFAFIGNEVTRDGRHFCLCKSVQDARTVAEAMNAAMPKPSPVMHQYSSQSEPVRTERTAYTIPGDNGLMTTIPGQMHTIRREGDEYACTCGMRWDATEGDDHP